MCSTYSGKFMMYVWKFTHLFPVLHDLTLSNQKHLSCTLPSVLSHSAKMFPLSKLFIAVHNFRTWDKMTLVLFQPNKFVCVCVCVPSCHLYEINPLKPELNPICYLLALLGAHHFFHVSRIRVKLLTLRWLMSYIYGAPILDVSRSHTTTQHSR